MADRCRAPALAIALVAAALSAAPGPAAREPELWAGRWVLEGQQRVPVFGEVKTRTERLVLATVERTADAIELVEQSCAIRLGSIAGVRLDTRDENARALPRAHIRFEQRGAQLRAGPWRTTFGRDEGPTLEVHVAAPLCGGTLQVASDSLSIARARPRRDGRPGLEGEVRTRVQQSIRDASGSCLRSFAHDTEQQLTGRLAFVVVPPGSTCTSLAGKFPPVSGEDGSEEHEGPFATH